MLALEKVWNEYNRAQLCTDDNARPVCRTEPGHGSPCQGSGRVVVLGRGGGSKTLYNNYKK